MDMGAVMKGGKTGMGVKMREGNGREWEIKKVLYVADTILVIETREYLQHNVSEFERAYDRIGLKMNARKN